MQRTLAKAEEERKNTHAELIESQVEEERLRNTIKELKLQLEEQAHDHRSSQSALEITVAKLKEELRQSTTRLRTPPPSV